MGLSYEDANWLKADLAKRSKILYREDNLLNITKKEIKEK